MIAENLQKLRKSLSLGQNEFALKLGINPRAYVNYERGDRKPPYEMLITLSNEFNVNLNWLIVDKDEMFNNEKFEGKISYESLENKMEEMLRKHNLID